MSLWCCFISASFFSSLRLAWKTCSGSWRQSILTRPASTLKGSCLFTTHWYSTKKEPRSPSRSLSVRYMCTDLCVLFWTIPFPLQNFKKLLRDGFIFFFFFFPPLLQLLLQLVHTRGLSYSCCGLLLQVISSFLLAENLSLPASMIQELVKKVCACTCVHISILINIITAVCICGSVPDIFHSLFS